MCSVIQLRIKNAYPEIMIEIAYYSLAEAYQVVVL